MFTIFPHLTCVLESQMSRDLSTTGSPTCQNNFCPVINAWMIFADLRPDLNDECLIPNQTQNEQT